MISFEFHLEKWHEKTLETVAALGFSGPISFSVLLVGKSNVHGYNAPCFDSVVHIFEDSVLMRRDNEDRRDTVALPVQEFSCSLLYHLFHQLQPIIGQIIPGVLPEAEGKQMAQTFFMGRGKHLFCRTDIVIVNAG